MIPATEAYVMSLGNVVVKARGDDGKRIVEVQCSSEDVDSEGDVVMQKALLDSADSFVRSGHLDIDHISEIGSRIGIRNPESYIIGRPLEVKDMGGQKTNVVGELMRGETFDPERNRYDSIWKSLQSNPPVKWSASIYGFPTQIDDCTEKACSSGATRYVIKAIDWRSLALTRNPVNQSLKGYAKVVTAKALVDEILKGQVPPMGLSATMPISMLTCPMNMDGIYGQYQRHKKDCPFLQEGNSVLAFQHHFMACCGASPDAAEVMANAIMYFLLKEKKRSSG